MQVIVKNDPEYKDAGLINQSDVTLGISEDGAVEVAELVTKDYTGDTTILGWIVGGYDLILDTGMLDNLTCNGKYRLITGRFKNHCSKLVAWDACSVWKSAVVRLQYDRASYKRGVKKDAAIKDDVIFNGIDIDTDDIAAWVDNHAKVTFIKNQEYKERTIEKRVLKVAKSKAIGEINVKMFVSKIKKSLQENLSQITALVTVKVIETKEHICIRLEFKECYEYTWLMLGIDDMTDQLISELLSMIVMLSKAMSYGTYVKPMTGIAYNRVHRSSSYSDLRENIEEVINVEELSQKH